MNRNRRRTADKLRHVDKRRRGARHETWVIMTITGWGEASRAPIDGPPIAPQQSGFRRASSRVESGCRGCRGSSSSVYLFALEAYSSPIPTASAMGLIERRPAAGGWSMVAKGRRRRGTWASDRQTRGMLLSSDGGLTIGLSALRKRFVNLSKKKKDEIPRRLGLGAGRFNPQ